MSLDTEEQVRQTWGSHIPVLMAVMKNYPPKTVLECGCGNYSTPIVQMSPNVLTIEHDCKWADEVKTKYPSKEGFTHNFIVYPVPAYNHTQRSQMNPDMLKNFDNLYVDWARNFQKTKRSFDLLFVDTFSAARVPAVLAFRKFAQMFIIHDVEPGSWEYYDWHLIEPCEGFHCYLFRPEGYINTHHRIPWTRLYSRQELDVQLLQKTIDEEAMKLWAFSSPLEKIK